jgi:cell division transport system permease protein
MSGKKKHDSRSFANQKRTRRRLVSTRRIIMYGISSFFRNSWLSVAATLVMTITLLIIFITVASHIVLTNTISNLRDKVDMSIYLKTDTTDSVADSLRGELLKLPSVKSVVYISASEARQQIVDKNKDNVDVLEAIKEATNKNPATLRVVITDINDTRELEDFVNNNQAVKPHLSSDFKPSFAGERRDAIQSIGRAVGFIQQVGVVAGVIFVLISSLIIFNTIRMAIFNRRDEIEMMKLIGADRSFIRGPFLVESVIYGLIAAFFATGLGMFLLIRSAETLESYQISVQSTVDMALMYSGFVFGGMVLVGALIGIISSVLATKRYLKV